MKFGLTANLRRVGAIDAIQKFIDWSADNDHELVIASDLREAITGFDNFADADDLAPDVDILVSMGGDGTLLATARSVGRAGTPILGINLGSLGFLTQQTPQQLVKALDAIVAGDYRIENRLVLKAEVLGEPGPVPPYALNDIVIDNGPVSRVLNIVLRVNGEDVVTYTADGLVISTPTGSTAYSLAVGGPIVKPGMDAIIASPIAPFSLTTRPMIFSGDDTLEIFIASEGRVAHLTLDGQVGSELHESQVVRISQADYHARLVVFPDVSYYKLLRSKLNWGIPPNF